MQLMCAWRTGDVLVSPRLLMLQEGGGKYFVLMGSGCSLDHDVQFLVWLGPPRSHCVYSMTVSILTTITDTTAVVYRNQQSFHLHR